MNDHSDLAYVLHPEDSDGGIALPCSGFVAPDLSFMEFGIRRSLWETFIVSSMADLVNGER